MKPRFFTGVFRRSKLYAVLRNFWIAPRGREAFLRTLPFNSRILDVGCGNNSPGYTKGILPGCYYVGLDVEDYNQSQASAADEYVLVAPLNFAEAMSLFSSRFDAVISNHNLEHCNAPDQVLDAMLGALKVGGRIYLAFPCEQSVNFPNRDGSLNFFDDATHQGLPPNFHSVINRIEQHGLKVEFAARNYRPIPLYFIGWFNEKRSKILRKTLTGTWAYHGFETIIHARKVR
jgi:SAM-dependent methyltransferase